MCKSVKSNVEGGKIVSREVILYIAQTVDGYIAEKDGSIGFLDLEIPEDENSYIDLMEKIDTVIMGRKTYDQVVFELLPDNYPYTEKLSYVITRRVEPQPAEENRLFVDREPVELVKELREQEGKAIWIIGGESIITPLVEANLIDTYVITTIPILLGDGIPLFGRFASQIPLTFVDSYERNGMVFTTYHKK